MPGAFRALFAALSIGLLATPVAAGATDLAEIIANGGCPGCDLSLAEMRGVSLSGANFARADLREADLKGASLADAIFVRADLKRVEMERAQLVGADFSLASMRGADLEKADLSMALFDGADLTGADLSRAHLRRTNLSGADLTGVRGLTARRLAQACGDAATKLPKGFSIKPCGAASRD
ncbi:MAG: pentapeptide repeat-containing protein [Proteobacteria bacterium]|nr:pentapeptide repeat-containing protein [Pseudomonadota bacterium]